MFAHEANGWTVFDDYTGYLGGLPAERWISLAGDDELVFAGYNDAIPYGQLIVVREGRIVREFLHDLQDPSNNVNHGRLELERSTLIDDWVDAAWFVDSDELVGRSRGRRDAAAVSLRRIAGRVLRGGTHRGGLDAPDSPGARLALAGCAALATAQPSASLKDAYRDAFRMGVAINAASARHRLGDAATRRRASSTRSRRTTS